MCREAMAITENDMKIKTSELTGAALDWAVAKADGKTPKIDCTSFRDAFIYRVYLGWSYEHSSNGSIVEYKPSTDWAQGGPIIEREDISFRKYHRPDSEAHGKYYARICRESGVMVGWYKTTGHQQTGPTPLIAAMRCYVASKLGDAVNVPEELQ